MNCPLPIGLETLGKKEHHNKDWFEMNREEMESVIEAKHAASLAHEKLHVHVQRMHSASSGLPEESARRQLDVVPMTTGSS